MIRCDRCGVEYTTDRFLWDRSCLACWQFDDRKPSPHPRAMPRTCAVCGFPSWDDICTRCYNQ